MPNEPKPAKENRTLPTGRQNAQDDHEGSSHKPEEFLDPTTRKDISPDRRPPDSTQER